MKSYKTRTGAIATARKLYAEITETKAVACTIIATEDDRFALLWSMPVDSSHVGMWLCHKGHATMIGASLPTGVRIELAGEG